MPELMFKKLYGESTFLDHPEEDAAFDLTAFIPGQKFESEDERATYEVPRLVNLDPGARKLVKCGVAVAIPEGHVGLVCPRSGLALKYGVTVLNAPGVIDPGYRGEVGVILVNLSNINYVVENGDRIAQLLIIATASVRTSQVQHLPESTRGSDGFGSTGR